MKVFLVPNYAGIPLKMYLINKLGEIRIKDYLVIMYWNKIILWMFLFYIIIFFFGCLPSVNKKMAETKMLQIDEKYNQQEIELSVGQLLEISLPENPTTGFQWILKYSGEPVCTIVNDSFDPQPGPPGQGGIHHWKFQTTGIGEGEIKLVYSRPWEQEKSSSRVFTLRVRVIK